MTRAKSVIDRIKIWVEPPVVQLFLLFALLIIIRFYPIFFQGKALVFGDNYSLMVPGKLFTTHWLKRGVLPLWNPTILGGIPWIGDVNQSVLYPSTLLFLFLPAAAALNWTVILHLLLTFVGMYLLTARWLKNQQNSHFVSLVAAVLWSLSTQVTGSINNLSTIQSLAWMPWVAFFGLNVTRHFRAKVGFALVVLLQFAGGYPQHVIYSILTAVLLATLRDWGQAKFSKWIQSWFFTALFTVGLSTMIWLPFINTLVSSTRLIQSGNQALAGSLHPAELIKMIAPYFFDCPAQGVKWGPSWNSMPNAGLFISWFGLFVLGSYLVTAIKNKTKLRKEKLALILFVVIAVLFSFGEHLPLDLSLILKSARGPSIMLTMANLLLILLAAQIWGELFAKDFFPSMSLKVYRWLWVLLFGFGIIGLISITNFELVWNQADQLFGRLLSASKFHTVDRDQIIVSIIFTNIFVNGFLFLLQLKLITFSHFNQFKKLIFLLILVVEMIFNTQAMLLFAPNKVYSVVTPVFEKTTSHGRWLIRNSNQPYTDFNSFWEALVVRKPFSDSFVDKKQLQEFSHLKRLKKGMTPDWNMPVNASTIHGYTTLMPQDFNRIWNQTSDPAINNLPTITLHNENLSQWAVKYYLVDNWFDVTEDLSQYQKVAQKDHWTLYELPALSRFRYSDQSGVDFSRPAQSISETPNQIKLQLNNDTDQEYLIIADRFDKNWQAEVNGQPVRVENFNSMRRIPIQSGKNQVILHYQPFNFYLGLVFSGITLLLIFSLFCLQKMVLINGDDQVKIGSN